MSPGRSLVNPPQPKVVFAQPPRSRRAAQLYNDITGRSEWPLPVGEAEGVLCHLSDEELAGKLRATLVSSPSHASLASLLDTPTTRELKVRPLWKDWGFGLATIMPCMRGRPAG